MFNRQKYIPVEGVLHHTRVEKGAQVRIRRTDGLGTEYPPLSEWLPIDSCFVAVERHKEFWMMKLAFGIAPPWTSECNVTLRRGHGTILVYLGKKKFPTASLPPAKWGGSLICHYDPEDKNVVDHAFIMLQKQKPLVCLGKDESLDD